MRYEIIYSPEAEEDLRRHAKAGNKILLKKISKLLQELEEHPEIGTGKPEKLKYQKIEYWSRRIDDRHRMGYTIDNDIVNVFLISLWGHYGDK
jgi:toxin YoeB